MNLFKKIGLFVVFLVTLSQAMGSSISCFQEQLIAIENNENSSPSNEYFSLDFDEIEDENTINTTVPCFCVIILEQPIAGKNYQFDTSFNFTFWQPPKIL
jgi:predicted metalloenzyme YecM